MPLAFCACAGAGGAPQRDEGAHTAELYFFYDESCDSCDGTKGFYEMFNEIISEYKDSYSYKIYAHNVFTTSGMKEYRHVAEEYGIATGEYDFPLLIAGGGIFSGMKSIRDNLEEALLAAAESAK
jgi:hypothetical protein